MSKLNQWLLNFAFLAEEKMLPIVHSFIQTFTHSLFFQIQIAGKLHVCMRKTTWHIQLLTLPIRKIIQTNFCPWLKISHASWPGLETVGKQGGAQPADTGMSKA